MSEAMFKTVLLGEHGNTVECETPESAKLEAYKNAAMLSIQCGVGYRMEFHADDSVTVMGDNGSQMTFQPKKEGG